MGEKVKIGPFGGGYSFTLRFSLVLSFLFLEGMLLNISGFSVFMKPYLIKAAVRNTGAKCQVKQPRKWQQKAIQ